MTIPVINERTQRNFWAKVSLPDSDGCMRWTASKDAKGYGHMGVSRKVRPAHRISLYLAEGEPPFAGAHAAHSCRNRDCVAPDHLRWATPSENEADKIAHGVRSGGRVYLTDSQAVEIRRIHARGNVTQVELASRYGVSRQIIGALLAGRTYRKAGA